jgi:hypothetical protein
MSRGTKSDPFRRWSGRYLPPRMHDFAVENEELGGDSRGRDVGSWMPKQLRESLPAPRHLKEKRSKEEKS